MAIESVKRARGRPKKTEDQNDPRNSFGEYQHNFRSVEGYHVLRQDVNLASGIRVVS